MKIAFSILFAALLIVGAAVGGLAWQRICLPLRGVEVTVNGEHQNDALAHICPNGRILVRTPGQPTILIDRDWQGGSYPNAMFENILGFTFVWDPDPGGVSFTSTAKTDVDPQLKLSDTSIAYTSMGTHDRIVIRRGRS